MPFEQVTDILGTVNSILTSNGSAFSFDKLKGTANAIQHLAAKQSTTPEKLMSFLQRGAGAAQVLGMSQEAGLAFGSASTSLGNQAGQSGRMFDYLASRVIEMPRLTRQHGQEGRQARDLVRSLGYGSAGEMDAERRANPDAFLPDLTERFHRIRDPKKQEEAIRFFTGREWLGEFGRIVKGFDTYREAVKLATESKGFDAIGQVWGLHKTKLGFVMKQFTTGFKNILGEFGKELSPLARQFGDYFLAWTQKLRNGGISKRFKAALTGFIEGLGFKDMPALLEGLFGKPGEGDAGSVKGWGDAARGLGAGLRDVGHAIETVLSVFGGGSADPETIGRWAARLGALALACVVVAPVIGVLSGLSTALMALGFGAAAVWRGLKALGLGRGAGGILGRLGFSGIGTMLSRFFTIGIVAEIGANRGPIVTWMLDAFRVILDALKEALATVWDELKTYIKESFTGEKIWERLLDEVTPAPFKRWKDGRPKVEKQSASDDWHGLIEPASFETIGDLSDSVNRLNQTLGVTNAKAQLAAFTAPSTAALAGFRDIGGAGGFGGGGGGFSPPVPSVPSWYGGGGGGGGGATGRGDTTSGTVKGGYDGPTKPAGAGDAMAPAGTRASSQGTTTIKTKGGKTFKVDARFARNFESFLNDYEANGGVIGPNSGSLGERPKNASYHPIGRAIDINQVGRGVRRGGKNLPLALEDALAKKWGLRSGNTFRSNDNGHFEVHSQAEASAALERIDGGKGGNPTFTPDTGAVGAAPAGSLTGLIDREAKAAGIDPRIMQGIRAGESGHRSDYDINSSSREDSYGPFQLNRMGGLGQIFEKQTGLSVRDPKTIPQQTRWVARYIARKLAANPNYNPRSEWYGYKGKMDADPSWGNSGYRPSPTEAAAMSASGWKAGLGGNAKALINPSEAAKAVGGERSPQALAEQAGAAGRARTVPLPPERPKRQGADRDGGRAGGNVHVIQHINGYDKSPAEIAALSQRHIADRWNYRAHDLEPELT